MAPRSVSDPPTMESPSPIGFPSSSLSFTISIVVSVPGTISHLVGSTLVATLGDGAAALTGSFFSLMALLAPGVGAVARLGFGAIVGLGGRAGFSGGESG